MMPKTRSRKIADLLSPASVAGTLSVDGGGGVATYTAIGDLPSSGLTAGDMAFVDSSDRLYIWAGSGWYNIALINRAPTIQSVLDSDGGSSPFALSNEGVATTITMLAQDSDGTLVTYSAVADSDFNAMATVSQSSNVFTITPTAIEGANTGTITFKASDGINLASEISTFTLSFIIIIENSRYTTLLVQSAGANNGINNTFTDASSNSLAITTPGSFPQATTFSPYRAGGYSTHFTGAADYLLIANSSTFSTFTVEGWFYPTTVSGEWRAIWGTDVDYTNIGRLYQNGGTLYLYTGYGMSTSVGSVFAADQWYYIKQVYDGTTTTLYVNGVSIYSGTALTYNGAGNIILGHPSYPIQGYIRDFRLRNIADNTNIVPTEPIVSDANTVIMACNKPYLSTGVFVPTSGTTNSSIKPFGPYDHEPYDPAVNGTGMVCNLNHTITAALSSPIGTGDFTIECWAMAGSNIGSDNGIWGLHETTAYAAGYINGGFMVREASGFYYVLGPGTARTVTSPAFLLNMWYHTAIVRQSGVSKFYINGKLINTTADTVNRTNVYLLLGGYYSTGAYLWDGYIADFRITSNAVYTTEFTPPSEPLETIAGTLVHINSQPAIIDASQSSALTLVGNTKSSTTQIKYGNSSMYFDGVGGETYVDADSTVANFGTKDFTIEMWVYPTATGRGIFNKTTDTGSASPPSVSIYNPDSGNLLVGVNDGNSTGNWNNCNAPLLSNQWSHLALTRQGTTLRAFLNGITILTTTNSANVDNNVVFGIGQWRLTASNFMGYMQDVRITKGLARYTTTFTPPAALLEG
jgi:hypothetical protein